MVDMVNNLVAGGLLAWRDGRWHADGSIDTATDQIPSDLQELIGRGMHGLELLRRPLPGGQPDGTRRKGQLVPEKKTVRRVSRFDNAGRGAVRDARIGND